MYALAGGRPASARTAPSPAIGRLIRASEIEFAILRAAVSTPSSLAHCASSAAATRWPDRVSASIARSRERQAQAAA
jgi:hypothetical protein